MTHQIRLEKWLTTKDGIGNNTEQVVTEVNVFAEVRRLSGDRASLNGQTFLDNMFQFRFRFNPKIDPTGNWRIIYDGRRFTVHSIEQEEQRRFYWIVKAEANKKKTSGSGPGNSNRVFSNEFSNEFE